MRTELKYLGSVFVVLTTGPRLPGQQGHHSSSRIKAHLNGSEKLHVAVKDLQQSPLLLLVRSAAVSINVSPKSD